MALENNKTALNYESIEIQIESGRIVHCRFRNDFQSRGGGANV